ncbi:MAG: pyridoxal 5'-phosphate synthase glutaminase subunit PdxT [Candidatus Micrarchaeota archaeon]
MLNIGVLALQGGVAEHVSALRQASEKAKIPISVRTVRTPEQLAGLHALLMPGGESTVLSLLLERQGMLEPLRSVQHLFGTCAGLILMAKGVEGKAEGQRGLGLMDISVSRNAYGSQADSFESRLEGALAGKTKILFIRAPKILKIGPNVQVLASLPGSNEPVIVMQKQAGRILLGATCHPELTTSKVHEFFLKQISDATG